MDDKYEEVRRVQEEIADLRLVTFKQRKRIEALKIELEELKSSREYALGEKITAPVRIFRRFGKRKGMGGQHDD